MGGSHGGRLTGLVYLSFHHIGIACQARIVGLKEVHVGGLPPQSPGKGQTGHQRGDEGHGADLVDHRDPHQTAATTSSVTRIRMSSVIANPPEPL